MLGNMIMMAMVSMGMFYSPQNKTDTIPISHSITNPVFFTPLSVISTLIELIHLLNQHKKLYILKSTLDLWPIQQIN